MRNLKKVLSLVLAMAMMLSVMVVGAGAAFKDSDKIADEYAVAVEFAAQTGILEGFENGTYGPQKTLTRAQLATMTYRIATGDVDDVYTADFAGGAAAAFTDTAADAWYAGYVGYAADAGYLKGCGEGLYKPNSAMTGYQALAAFLRVVGYNQPGQFTGADWTVQVAMIANEIGALEGITNVDLNAAISREVAAQILFNILFSDIVAYTPAFGYQNALFQNTLVEDVFGIAPISVDERTEPWGQPATQWHYNDKEAAVAVSIPFAPVAEYTVAVDECDLAKDLGIKEGIVTDWYLNGAEYSTKDDIINIEHDAAIDNAAQGTLTEVYEVGGAYWFVQIETVLGQIGDTWEASFDKNGHEITPAKAELTVFECNNHEDSAIVVTDEFAEDDYVLVNYSFMTKEFFLEKTAPVDTATLTYKSDSKEFSTIGGKDYNWAAHYHQGNPGVLNTKYDVFVDFYGNLIGLFEVVEEVESFITIWESAIAVTNGYNPYIAGKEVDLTTGALKDITVCDNINKYSDREVAYFHDIVEYTVCDDGEYEMTQVGTEYDGYIIEQGNSNIVVADFVKAHIFDRGHYEYDTILVDDNTVFAIEDECGEYEIVVGYKNIDSMRAFAEIETYNDGEDAFEDIVYIDASTAFFPGEETVAYIMEGCEYVAAGTDGDNNYVVFENVVVNGEVVDVMCDPAFNLANYAGEMVTLKADASTGLVYAAVVDNFFVDAIVDDNSGDIFVIDGVSYDVTADTTIWVVNEAEGTCEIGTAADVEQFAKIFVKFVPFSNDADTIIVWA